jgi:hypothetical protein
LDITVATPMKQEFLRCNAAATTPGVAAAHAERTKHEPWKPLEDGERKPFSS